MNKIKILSLSVVMSFFYCGFCFAEDAVAITNYYPSPYGSYQTLTSNTVIVGSGYRASTVLTNGLIVQGQVGIGTSSVGSYGGKQAELDVNGEIAANDIYIKDKSRWISDVDYLVGS